MTGLKSKAPSPTSGLGNQDFSLPFCLTKGRRAPPESHGRGCWAAAGAGSEKHSAVLPQRCLQRLIALCELRVAFSTSLPHIAQILRTLHLQAVIELVSTVADISGIPLFIHFLSFHLTHSDSFWSLAQFVLWREQMFYFHAAKLAAEGFPALKSLLTLSSLLCLTRGVRRSF